MTAIKYVYLFSDMADIKARFGDDWEGVRALLGAFCSANPVCFHDVSGAGYRLLGEYVERLNELNPQIAARLLSPMTRWHRFDAGAQAMMKAELERLSQLPQLSPDVYELVNKSLK